MLNDYLFLLKEKMRKLFCLYPKNGGSLFLISIAHCFFEENLSPHAFFLRVCVEQSRILIFCHVDNNWFAKK